MKLVSQVALLSTVVCSLVGTRPVLALSNRVFVSARSGNDSNACDYVGSPCQTFAGAVIQLNPGGEVIVLDSGGYGPVTITQSVTIEAPAGVTAFIHPPSGDAVTVNAPGATVTLRGLTLNGGSGNGVNAKAVGTLNVERCVVTGFAGTGVYMGTSGHLNVAYTDAKGNFTGVAAVNNTSALVSVTIDHCHLDENLEGYAVTTGASASSVTTATYSTASNNTQWGWVFGAGTGLGVDTLNLESCSGSQNGQYGLLGLSANAASRVRFSNCTFANNVQYGLARFQSGLFESRGNNTVTGNGSGAANAAIGSYAPM